MPEILILGGYGNAGRQIAELLLRHTSVNVIIAGRRADRAGALAAELNARHGAGRATARQLDAAQLRGADLATAGMVLAASSSTEHARRVAEAAIEARIDYFDIQLSSPRKWEALRALAPRIERAGLCFITDGGYHPGVPAALVRYAAERIPEMGSAVVCALMRLPWRQYEFSAEAVEEFVAEFQEFRPVCFSGGRWVESWTTSRKSDFGPPFGTAACQPMDMEEMRALPGRIPGLRETGFFVSGFDAITNNLTVPVVYVGLKVLPRAAAALGRLFRYSLQTFARPPYGCVITLEARGKAAGKLRLRLSHEDGYFFTAAPVVACVKQYLAGGARRPGLHCQGMLVEPAAFLADLGAMGIKVETVEDGVGR